ncbi:MAG TPA: RDD family protein [Candidatus Binatia bacterium]|nr:RDD family protein [Candidatus Binatia bacterium]
MDPPAAGFWRRQGAWWLDRLIGVALWALCAMWLVVLFWATRGWPRDLPGALVLAAAMALLGVALSLVYQIAFVGGCGQTPGHMAFGIAVVRRGGGAMSHGRALARSLGGILTALTLGIGLLPVLFTRERRGLPDMVAGTRMVRVRAARVPAPSGWAAGRGASEVLHRPRLAISGP